MPWPPRGKQQRHGRTSWCTAPQSTQPLIIKRSRCVCTQSGPIKSLSEELTLWQAFSTADGLAHTGLAPQAQQQEQYHQQQRQHAMPRRCCMGGHNFMIQAMSSSPHKRRACPPRSCLLCPCSASPVARQLMAALKELERKKRIIAALLSPRVLQLFLRKVFYIWWENYRIPAHFAVSCCFSCLSGKKNLLHKILLCATCRRSGFPLAIGMLFLFCSHTVRFLSSQQETGPRMGDWHPRAQGSAYGFSPQPPAACTTCRPGYMGICAQQ